MHSASKQATKGNAVSYLEELEAYLVEDDLDLIEDLRALEEQSREVEAD